MKINFRGRHAHATSSSAKLLLVMKLTVLLTVIACLHAGAKGISQKITMVQRNTPLHEVFKELKKQTGYSFTYNLAWMQRAKNVTLSVTNENFELVLHRIFKEQPFTYGVVDKTVVLRLKEEGTTIREDNEATLQAMPPPDDLRGRVTDSTGNPLAGAAVLVKGSNKKYATDEKGEFLIPGVRAEGLVLSVSFIGNKTQELVVNSSSKGFLLIVMKAAVTLLQDVAVINTGYQTISRERSAGSFAKPDMEVMQARSGTMNVLQRLDGLVPGLTINNAPNVPLGATGASPILVRGLTTIGISDPDLLSSSNISMFNGKGTNRSPLYVVDGIPIDDVASINPQDVADITVLKDATAASIWGARASNGVIVIATKKGKINEKIKISYDGFVNFQGKPNLDYQPTLDSKQFIQAAREIYNNPQKPFFPLYPWATVSGYTSTVSTGVPPHEMILYNQYRGLISDAQAAASLDSLAGISNRDQIKDLWYRNAMLMNHTFSLSGGTRVHSFYGSMAYTNAQSNRPGEKNQTYKLNLRQDFILNKRIQFYLITDLTNTTTAAKRTINIDNNFFPYQLFRDESGKNLPVNYMMILSDSTRKAYAERSRISLDYNPLDEFNYGYTKSDAFLGRFTSGVTLKLLPGLRFEGVYGFVKGNNKTRIYEDLKSYAVRSEIVQFTVAPTTASTPVYYLPVNGGRYTVNASYQRNWTVRNQLIYDKEWNNGKHQVTLLAGQEAQDQLATSNINMVRGYNELLQTSGYVDYYTLSTTGVTGPVMVNNSGRSIISTSNIATETEVQTRFTSYYANAAYTYNGRYALNGSWRIDKSNLFGLDKSAQNRPVWSVGAKWIINKENFMQPYSFLSQLALRATYGITGNSPSPGTAASYDILQAGTSNFFPGGTGLRIASAANRKLTWETTTVMNAGIDFGFLNDRISGSIDLYRKKTDNLLGNFEVNGFSGYSFVNGNMGSLENKGVELNLSTVNIRTRSFNWSSSLILAYNNNKILTLNNVIPVSTGAQKVSQFFLPGYTAFAVFAYEYAGLDNMGDPQVRLSTKETTKAPSVTKPADIKYMGTFQPVWNGGLSNMFRYKGFGMAANMVYSLGHVMRRGPNKFFSGRLYQESNVNTANAQWSGNKLAEFANRWKKEGDEAFTNIPSYEPSSSLNSSRRNTAYYTNGDLNVVSASYIKLRDISLFYSLPQQLLKKIKTEEITFRIQLSNLMLWKANKYGIDPEFQNTLSNVMTMPVNQHTITFGAHVTF